METGAFLVFRSRLILPWPALIAMLKECQLSLSNQVTIMT
jgi:hypothetical protein